MDPALLRSWAIGIDVAPPDAASGSPPPGTETLFGSPNASIGMLACDDDSGISLSPDAATIEEASGAVPANITGHVDRRDEGSPCVEILFLLEPPVGSSNWTITLHDAVGNAGRIENILIRRLPVGIRFSQFTPDGPLPVLAINASVRAQAPVGAQVNLSSVEWSISDGPGDARSWNSANLTGASDDALLTALLPLPYSEVFYLQWSATLVGSDEPIHSPLFIVTGDVEPPFGGDLVCGPLVDDVSSVSVTLGDNTTLVNWDALHIVVTDGSHNARDVSARLVEAVSTTAGNAAFDVPIWWGVNRIDVVAHDAVGNPLAETFCQVTGPTPFNPTGLPGKGGTTTWVDDWVLFMLAIVVAAAVFVYVALRVGHGRGDD